MKSKFYVFLLLGVLFVKPFWTYSLEVNSTTPNDPFVWVSEIPADCPFEKSDLFAGLSFTIIAT